MGSRALYAILGLRFDASPFDWYMQFLDRELLSTRLLESLWYYHANPPILNLLAGVGYKLFGERLDWYFAVVFHCLGAAIALSVYLLSLRLSGARVAARIATALLLFSPAFVLYENWLMYTFPTAALLTMSAVALYRYVETSRTMWAAAFFSILALMLLTRSLFHIVWMVVIVALLAIVVWRQRRQVLVAAAMPLIVVALWYGKNYYYFGSFSSSTWFGLGLSNISTLVPTREELRPLVDDHRLSPWALVSRYKQMDQLFATPRELTGIAVLDQVRKPGGQYNFNNIRMVELNRRYTADAITVARTFPHHYVTGLLISNRLFFSPANTSFYFSDRNRAAVWPLEHIFNPLLYGAPATTGVIRQPHFGFGEGFELEVNTSIPLIVVWCVLLGYGGMQAYRGFMSADPGQKPRAVVLGFVVITAVYLYFVSTAFELGENYRYRFLIEPLMFVVAATAVTDVVRRHRKGGIISASGNSISTKNG